MNSADPAVFNTPRRRVTAAMVAEHAGVSTATVSLVANGKSAGRVSASNAQRVRLAIDELGYVIDGIGSSLARGVSSTVIMVAPDISNAFFAQLIAGVRQVLGASYQLLLAVTDPGVAPDAADTRKLLGLRPAGLLIDAPSPEFLRELGTPVPLVAIDAPDAPHQVPAVNLDVAQGARMLAQHFAEQGHRIIAYMDANTGTSTLRLRRAAFLEAAAELGITVPDEGVCATTIDVGTAARSFAEIWPRWHTAGITAIACATDTQAYGVLQEARVAGLEIPGQLAVAGFDDLPYSATSHPGLTSVNLGAEQLGRIAAEQLLRVIGNEELPNAPVLLDCSLVVRSSTLG